MGRFVLELSVVHDLADWGLGVWCDLDKIQVCVERELAGIFNSNDANLLTIWTDKADLGNSDTLINASFSADVDSSVSSAEMLTYRTT